MTIQESGSFVVTQFPINKSLIEYHESVKYRKKNERKTKGRWCHTMSNQLQTQTTYLEYFVKAYVIIIYLIFSQTRKQMTQLFPSIAEQNTLFEGKFETDMVNSGQRLGLVQNIESISTKFSYPHAYKSY